MHIQNCNRIPDGALFKEETVLHFFLMFLKCLRWCEHVGTQVALVILVDGCSTAGRQEDEHIVSVTHSCSYTSIHYTTSKSTTTPAAVEEERS